MPKDAPKDAIELLVNDHRKVRGMLDELSQIADGAPGNAPGDATGKRDALLAQIEKELQIHSRIEEEIFYPAFREAGGTSESKMFFEAIEEHRAVDELVMPDLKNTASGSERFCGRAKVLKELVEHHADGEESEMFASARRIFSAEQLAELGARLERRKKELGA